CDALLPVNHIAVPAPAYFQNTVPVRTEDRLHVHFPVSPEILRERSLTEQARLRDMPTYRAAACQPEMPSPLVPDMPQPSGDHTPFCASLSNESSCTTSSIFIR